MEWPVILDVDPGVDDALALILATRAAELDVLGVCCVSGNVSLLQGTQNALKVLQLAGRDDVPVYVGAAAPLVRPPRHAYEVHGEDGLGGATLPDPAGVPVGDAVDFIVRSLEQRPGRVLLVACGPLTNLALAEARAPGVLQKARRIVAMGGTLDAPGNVRPTCEFNFYADPDAVRRVLQSGANLTLVPLDVTHRVGLEQAAFEAGPEASAVQRFCARAVAKVIDFEVESGGQGLFYAHDALAVALAMQPDLCRMQVLPIDIETAGELTAGQLVVDRRDVKAELRQGFAIECAVDVDVERFRALLGRYLLE